MVVEKRFQVVRMFFIWSDSQILVVVGGSEWCYKFKFAVDYSKVK